MLKHVLTHTHTHTHTRTSLSYSLSLPLSVPLSCSHMHTYSTPPSTTLSWYLETDQNSLWCLVTGQELSRVFKTHSNPDHLLKSKSSHSPQHCSSSINIHVPILQLLLFESMMYVARFDNRGAKSLRARVP